jgi:hypothetical protein
MVGKIVGDANIKKMCHDGYAAQAWFIWAFSPEAYRLEMNCG